MFSNFKNICFTLIICLISVFTVFGDKGLLKYMEHQEEVSKMKSKLSFMKEQITLQRDEAYKTKHNVSFLEKVSREELGLSRSGEIVYVFPDKQ